MTELTTAVVTVTPTIMDGTVVRWYRSEQAAEFGECVISASRNRISVHDDDYQLLSREWIAAAMQAYTDLRLDPRADMSHLATHRWEGLGRKLERISVKA